MQEEGVIGMQERIAQWHRLRKKHFKLDKSKSTSKVGQLKELPPGHIRQIMAAHGNMSHDKFAGQKRLYIGALKYAPHAVLKLLENMPMPWEELRKVRVLYHTAGALTFINEVPRVVPPQYIAQWAETWIAMRREKRDRNQIRRLRFPPFDDEQQPLDFVTNIEGLEPPEAILMELDEDEDAPVIEWFYDHLGIPLKYINGLSYKKWKLPLTVMSTLYRLARPLVDPFQDPNTKYLMDLPALLTSKALNEVIPGGPRFEPLFTDMDPNQEWTEFNDINKIIIRTPVSTEWKIAYPNLYNNRPRKISIAPYHYPMSCFAKFNTIITPVFQIAPNINSITRPQTRETESVPEEDLQPFTVNCDPLFHEIDHDDEEKQYKIYDTLSLFWAPAPFNCRTGNTQRAQDVPLIRPWYTQRAPWKQPVKVRVSYQKLLKNYVLNKARHRKQYVLRRKKSIFKLLKTTPYFQSTTLDWVEAGLQVVQQGFNMCNLLIKRHRLHFLHLDYNFNLKPIKTLNTKERRRSRFGNAYHLMREFFRFTKLLLDCHVQYRLGQIDAYVLADALQYTFTHAGHLTGMYRYKYKLMHQVRTCKDLKHVIYSRFNAGEVGKGPGVGFWGPMWRVWVFFMRGSVPLMERWLGSRVAREYEGRFSKRLPSTVTKQRVESNYDIELRAAVLHDINDVMPEGIRNSKAHTVLAHMSEAWRCWKANIPWKVPGLPPPLEAIILRYVKSKADWWVKNTHYARERINRDGTVDKALMRKNTGRLTRLYFKQQSDYQSNYLKEGPYITPEQGVAMVTTMQNWLEMRQFTPIPFPPMQYKHDTKMLILALENLRFGHDISQRMNQTLREELGLIENAHDNPHEALIRIKRDFMTTRAFREVKFAFLEQYTRVIPNYEVNALEKITDAYLDQYLWYEADRRHLFPPWVQPSDLMPPPLLVHKWCERINGLVGAWDTDDNQTMVIVETQLQKFYEQIDLTFLNYMLRLVVDHNLADYMTSKNNVKLSFKDMSFLNSVGLIHGLMFTSFIAQYMGLLVDLLILGLRRANEMAGPPSMPNSFLQFASIEDEIRHPIRLYQRYGARLHILYKFNEEQARDLIRDYCDVNSDPNNDNIIGYNNKTCWPRDARMRLIKHDVNLGRAVFWNLQNCLPRTLCEVNWNPTNAPESGFNSSFVSVYSKDNPNLLFYMCGFEVRILPKSRLEREDFTPAEGTWVLQDEHTHETTAFVFLKVSQKAITYFRNRIRTILLSSQATTFQKVSNKWNTAIIALVVYFREALVATPELLDEIVKSENRVQTRVKLELNSKMPNRFPPVVFYAPKEFGGLGLISMGHVLIPQSDLRYASQTMTDPTHFRAGMDHPEENFIPALYRYVQSWEGEIQDSKRVWQHYTAMRKEAGALNKRLTIEDLDSLWDRGIPRINVLFQRDRHTLAYDKGWRSRLYFKKYSLYKTNPFRWTHHHHDGKLWNLRDYRADVIQALGGVEGILTHTIFKATGYKSWEGLFWDNTTGFEEALKYRKLTNAQRMGMSQVPNRRYTLWWSPTINRANVYVGFQVQLDLTGIFMHGKIPSLKVSMIQLFRGHMWQKTHESIVMDIMQMLDSHLTQLQIDYVTKETIHPRKSYKMNSSCADLIMVSQNKWPSTEPCFVNDNKPFHTDFQTTRFWVDVQLRWGDYDAHDIERYTRSLFYSYTSGTQSMYPSSTGILVGIDLCYNEWTAFGTWIPGLQELIDKVMKHVMQFNPSIAVMRERVKKSLQLYTSEIPEPALNATNFGELFGNKTTWIVEDKHVYRVKIQKTFEGNYTTSPVNGGVFIMNPATGQLFLKIITTKAWQQQKRLIQLAKWKAAEETCALIRTLPPEEQPRQVICTSELLLDPVQSYLSEFPNTSVKGSDMDLPLPAFMKIPKIADEVIHAPEPKMVLYNLYDDWLETISSHAAFRRLMLVLRALLVSRMKAWDILRPTANVVTLPNHLWPSHNPDEWAEVEIRLKDLVVEVYCQKNNVAPSALTQSEIRDIILGVKIAAPSEERQKMAKEQDEQDASLLKSVTVSTRDADGNQHVVQTFSQYEQSQYKSKHDWRARALTARGLVMRANTLMVPPPTTKPKFDFYIPENVYRRFVEIADPYVQVCGILYGLFNEKNNLIQTFALLMPPQTGENDSIKFTMKLPEHVFLQGFQPVAYIHTRVGENVGMEPRDAMIISELARTNKDIDPLNFTNIVIGFPVGGCVMGASTLKAEGFEWAERNNGTDNPIGFEDSFATAVGINLTTQYNGWLMAPENGKWNYAFNALLLKSIDVYKVSIQTPKPFFDMNHRTQHFTSFRREMNGEDMAIDVDDNFA